jgi:F-type H+-transporting ATPase subunit b
MAQKAGTQAGTQAGTAVPEGGAHAKVFPPLDPGTFAPQLIWLALTFGLLYVVLKRVALPRVGEVIEERADRIKRDLAEAEKLKADTEAALANYEQALSEARAKANAIAKGMRDKLTAEVDKERAKVEAAIAAKLTEAEGRIADTKERALASVGDIATEVAGAIVARLIGREVSKDEVQRALVQRAAE